MSQGGCIGLGLNPDGTVNVRTKMCWICGQYSYIAMPEEAFKYWENYGVHIDDAWPDGPEEDLQLIRSGVHPKCWDAEFGNEEK